MSLGTTNHRVTSKVWLRIFQHLNGGSPYQETNPQMITESRVKKRKVIWPHILLVLLLLTLAGVYFYDRVPNWRAAPVPSLDRPKVVIGGLQVDSFALVSGETTLLPFETVQKHMDPALHWDAKSESLVVTTQDKVLTMQTESLTAYVNRRPVSLNVPATTKDTVYVPMDVLEPLYKIKGRVVESTGTIFYDFLTKPVQTAAVIARKSNLRAGPSIHEPIVTALVEGDMLEVIRVGEWYAATTKTGHFGFVREKEVALREVVTPKVEATQPREPWRPKGKINLTWEQVISKNPDVATVKDMPGLNIVSPTWFSVADEEGNVKNKADSRYVRWAHSKGFKVWALVDNGFDPARTSIVLSDLRKREKIIQQLLAYAALYSIDGINIDFENINFADRGLLVQFVRELAPLCREQGLTVSMDVTIKSKSPTWSMCYDRKALAEAVDYLMLMAYDEHTAGSGVAGSVGSLPWVEEGIKGVLEEVPAERLVLGVPFYTRLWREETKNGIFTVTSKALGMEAAEEALRLNQAVIQWDSESGQNFGVYREGSAQCKIWLEDQESMALRVALVRKYGLAGIASWRRGFEKPAIWNVLLNGLEQEGRRREQ